MKPKVNDTPAESSAKFSGLFLSPTYEALTTAQPTYLHNLISVQPIVILAPHLSSSSLGRLHLVLEKSHKNRINRSYASPHLWKQLPV